jgi:hypothetical protein
MFQLSYGNVLRLLMLFALSIQLFSCSRKLNPVRPEEKYNQVKVPTQRQLSIINVPITISITEVENQINSRLKDLLYEDNSLEDNGGDNFLLKVWKREPITVQVLEESFHITVPLRIWAKGGLQLGKLGINISEFKETEFALNVHFVSKIAIDRNWQVSTQTSANGFDWVSKPVLKIGFLELPLASIADRIIDKQQDRLAQQIDQQVAQKLDIKKQVVQGWQLLQQPILLSRPYDIWLRIIPSELLMTPIRGQGKQARALLGVKAYTETSIGQKPEIAVNPVIPPLTIVDEIPDEVSIGLVGEVSHAYATKVLQDNFLNKHFTLNEGKYHITLTSIELYGSGENLVIKAGIAGSVEGIVYLKGKPYFDTTSQSVVLQNLDYDLDTKNKLIKTASWLAKGKFVQKMQEAFKIPLYKQMNQAKEIIETNLTNKQIAKGITLNAQLTEFIPGKVFITPASIVATVQAKGKVQVKVEGLSQ